MIHNIAHNGNIHVLRNHKGGRKSYFILMGGQAKCFLLMTRGEGIKKTPKPVYVIHGCSLNSMLFKKQHCLTERKQQFDRTCIVNTNCQFSDWTCWSLVLLSAFYRISPKIPLPKSMQTFLEMSTNLNYSIDKLNTSSFKIRVD